MQTFELREGTITANGRIICKDLKANPLYSNIKVILFSASPTKLDNYEECNADGILPKPFELGQLLQLLSLF